MDLTPGASKICGNCHAEYIKVEGEKNVYVHPNDGFEVRVDRILRGSVIKTRAKGTLLLVPEKTDDNSRSLVHLNISAGYRGTTKVKFDGEVTVLAQGHHAQGIAGRMGGHDDFLVIMSTGATAKVQRFGRLYGAANELWVCWDGNELKLGTPDIFKFYESSSDDGVLV